MRPRGCSWKYKLPKMKGLIVNFFSAYYVAFYVLSILALSITNRFDLLFVYGFKISHIHLSIKLSLLLNCIFAKINLYFPSLCLTTGNYLSITYV